ncbi:MAG: hypothetical protein EB059_09140 [Alphaproteobacteria bacterium]|nr:hypothetical protein [Alphaproteobacteria bacterium]
MKKWIALLALIAMPAIAQTPVPAAPKSEALAKINVNDLCKGRAGCKHLWSADAGSVDTKHFIISEIVLPHTAANAWEKCYRPKDARYGEALDDVAQEIWLTTTGGLLQEHKKLFDLCNNGYGVAKVGDDQFTFDNQRITYRQAGGGNDRWVWARSYALPGLEASSILLCDYNVAAPGGHIRLMNYETGAFTSGTSPAQEDNTVDCNQSTINAAKTKYKAIDVKQIFSFLGIRPSDIKTLGSCATTLTSRAGPHQGYVIYGQDDGADVEVKFLRINDDKVWIDVRDPNRVFKVTDSDWVKDDRIEIWWLEQKLLGDKNEPSRKALRQFVIRLADLKVFAGYGYGPNTKLPEVERRPLIKDGSVKELALQVVWPAEQFPSPAGLTLSYAHADGHATNVMWATSNFTYADPQSLSPVRTMQSESSDVRKACAIDKDGVFNLVPPPGL